jgi:bacillithiol biosynthesis cysteine-adding enzyme BshC
VGNFPIDDPSLLEALKLSLAETDFSAEIFELLNSTQAESKNLGQWFARIITRLFHKHGLVLIDPNLPPIRRLSAPLMECAIDDPLTPSRLVNEAGERLQRVGYKRQITRPPQNCAFFLSEDGYRRKVTFDGSSFITEQSQYSAEDLKKILKNQPERFSAGVVIRPVISEYLFKSAATAGGPGEIGYFAQLKDVYKHFGVPMPVVIPRLSITVVEKRIRRILDNYGLRCSGLRKDVGVIISEVVRRKAEYLSDEYWQDIIKDTLRPICGFREEVEKKDKSFLQPVDNTLNKMSWQLGQLQDKVVKIAKKSEENIMRQITSARENLYPMGDLQERQLNIFYFLNKYSLGYIDCLVRDIPDDFNRHHVMEIIPDQT